MIEFIQRYVYRGKDVEGIVETRMRKQHEIKTKTTQVILLDPNSLTRHIKQANVQACFWVHCMIKDMQKCDPCLSDWKCQ